MLRYIPAATMPILNFSITIVGTLYRRRITLIRYSRVVT